MQAGQRTERRYPIDPARVLAAAREQADLRGLASTLGINYSRQNGAILREILERARLEFPSPDDQLLIDHRIIRQDWQYTQIGAELGINASSVRKRTEVIIRGLRAAYDQVMALPLRQNR